VDLGATTLGANAATLEARRAPIARENFIVPDIEKGSGRRKRQVLH
jgi:hypothetical protein